MSPCPIRFPVALLAALLCAPSLADEPARYGFGAGGFMSSFIGGDSGPVTPVSETRYPDTFGTGYGLRLEGYRNHGGGLRSQLGLVYASWSGKSFAGGEFPSGAQFGDLSLAGLYAGGRVAWASAPGWQPYVLGNLGLVRLSSLNVQSGATTIPYWSSRWRDYLELGAGIARSTGGGRSMTLDARLQVFGKPEAATYPIAAATSGSALMIAFGYEWEARR
jgi:hypothetical protein